jgi:hypothetical protein
MFCQREVRLREGKGRYIVSLLALAGEGLKREAVKEAVVTIPPLCCSLEITQRGEKYR